MERRDFLDNYFKIFEPIQPIVDRATFLYELTRFKDQIAARKLSWVAQYLMILALGASACENTDISAHELCYAAEACLGQTAFMFRPDLDAIRTVCLMVVMKQMDSATCWVLDSCWSLMGIAVRMTISLGLHLPTSTAYKGRPLSEVQSNETLWTVVVYLAVQSSLLTGMPSLLPDNDLLPSICAPCDTTPQACWTLIMAKSLPIIAAIVSRANSGEDYFTYAEVVDYNARLKEAMGMLSLASHSRSLQVRIDIFFRQALMTLHRRYALEPDAPSQYPTCYWTSLECSLAMLVHHRDLLETDQQPNQFSLVTWYFSMDFFSASATTCIHLLHNAIALPGGYAIPPRRTIIDALAACVRFLADNQDLSICLKRAYELLEGLMSMIPDARQS